MPDLDDLKLGFIGYEETGHMMSTQNTIRPGKWYFVFCGEFGYPFPAKRHCDRGQAIYANAELLDTIKIVTSGDTFFGSF